jgi:hypothetical protein
MPESSRSPDRRHRRARTALVTVTLVLFAALLPAAAAPNPTTPSAPQLRYAFVARNDVPFDSLAVGPVAGALGAIVVITSPTALSPDALAAITAYNPDQVVVVGGTAAISDEVANLIDAAGAWSVQRVAGATRDATAKAIADFRTSLGFGRPVLTGSQVAGDAYLRGGNLVGSGLIFEAEGDPALPTTMGPLYAIPIELPDVCAGGADHWKVMASAGGYLLTGPAPTGGATLTLTVDDAANFNGDNVININLPVDNTNGQNRINAHIEDLFTDVGSGAHTIRLLGLRSAPGDTATLANGRLIVEVKGVTC